MKRFKILIYPYIFPNIGLEECDMNNGKTESKIVLVCHKLDSDTTEKDAKYKNMNLHFHLVSFHYVLNTDNV
jgi:hypothetical protein